MTTDNCALCQMPVDGLALTFDEAEDACLDHAGFNHNATCRLKVAAAQLTKVPVIHEACVTRNLRLAASHRELLAAATAFMVVHGSPQSFDNAAHVLEAAIQNASQLAG